MDEQIKKKLMETADDFFKMKKFTSFDYMRDKYPMDQERATPGYKERPLIGPLPGSIDWRYDISGSINRIKLVNINLVLPDGVDIEKWKFRSVQLLDDVFGLSDLISAALCVDDEKTYIDAYIIPFCNGALSFSALMRRGPFWEQDLKYIYISYLTDEIAYYSIQYYLSQDRLCHLCTGCSYNYKSLIRGIILK